MPLESQPNPPEPPKKLSEGLFAEVQLKSPTKIWQLFGAMMTEDKAGHQAVSFTRVLAIALLSLAVLMWLGVVGPHQDTGEVPQTLLTTLWGLIGMKAAKDVIAGVRK
jgi:predicted anti-sigma-YlaC factor YlaD